LKHSLLFLLVVQRPYLDASCLTQHVLQVRACSLSTSCNLYSRYQSPLPLPLVWLLPTDFMPFH